MSEWAVCSNVIDRSGKKGRRRGKVTRYENKANTANRQKLFWLQNFRVGFELFVTILTHEGDGLHR